MFYVHDLHQRYGPVIRLSPTEISVSSPAASKHIYAVASRFEKTEFYSQFPPGMFTMINIQEHAQRRKLFAKAFSLSQIRTQWESTVNRMALLAVQRIDEEAKRDATADTMKWWNFMMADISGQVLFGEDFHQLQTGENNEFMNAVGTVALTSGIVSELPLIRTIGLCIPYAPVQKFFKYNYIVDKYTSRAVQKAKTQNDENRIIFANVLHDDADEKLRNTFSDEDIMQEAVSLTIAGTSTTSTVLTYLIWAVLTHPQLQSAVEEELATLPSEFSDAQLDALPLLSGVVLEALRLYTAGLGSLPRRVPKGGVTLEGYFIPEGVTISSQAYTMHHNEHLFPNSFDFDPARWPPEAGTSSLSKSVYTPFGAGARICIGMHLAQMELRFATAHFFRECRGARLAPSTTEESMKMKNMFLIWPASGRCEIVL